MKEPHGMFTHSDYTVGWICALPESELVAAMAMLDERHPVLPAIDPHDSNSYVLGSIGDHNVVVACLPAETTGKVSAATVAKDMIRSFPAVRFGLMVGIGGGAPYFGAGGSDNRTEAKEGGDSEDSDESDDDPADTRDIRLGDVAISLHSKSSDAVVQYDFGKSLQEKRFILSGGKLNKPPSIVLSAVALLQAQHRMEGHQILNTLSNIMSTYPALATKFQHPGPQKDYLFKAEFIHETGKKTCKRCRSQDSNLVKRDHRPDNSPRLHYGTIGSADQVMKDALLRDKWAREEGIICFEMEAAGLMDSFPCLVIRGICDYADSHKNKIWQPYAAATAACYAKELLHVISGQGVMIMDPVKQIEKSVREVYSIVKDTSAAVQDLSMRSRQRKVLDKLLYVEGSSFDASDAEHEARCHPETRVDLLKQILEWADNQRGECIFWLNGMAGTGKSTISRTIAQRFREKKQLGASFFFKRGEDKRASARRLFTTICAQLLLQNPTLIRYVESTIDKDPHISGKSLQEQFTKLLLEPILSLDGGECTNIVILIDALDECDNKDDIRTILQLLPDVQKCKSRNIRIFITSRPELPIRPVFEQNSNHRCLALHNLSDTVVGEDIRNFMKDEFSLIKERRKILGQWPGDDVLETLVRRAVPLFISAFTMCRFVDDPNWLPEDRLLMLLENPAAISGSPMDRTYLPVLQQLLLGAIGHEKKQLEQEFQDTVGVIILLANPLSVYALAQLIGKSVDNIINRLSGFYSVLSIPEDFQAPVRILHLSFRDYLLTRERESPFYVDEQGTHNKIALHCLRLMKAHLKQNICMLENYGILHKDIDPQIVKEHLTADIQYACRYWVHHLEQNQGQIPDCNVLSFLEKHFLHWLEALALIGGISEAVTLISTLQSKIWKSINAELSDFLYDADRFVRQNSYIARITPLQLYRAGLVFAPNGSIIKKLFYSKVIGQQIELIGAEESWSPNLQTFEGHSRSVNSVAFSPDGRTLASGSDDHTIKLWDPATGVEQRTLTSHSDSVLSVAFSPDGRMLASGSYNHTLKLWDTATGIEQYTLIGHSHLVRSVAFSPDGYTLASGSWDNTIKLWDPATGIEQHILTGHSRSVNSVAFSPDGRILASGSSDHTIKLWDLATGIEQRTLKGHSDIVQSVAFSPDGYTLASGSNDNTIKLWNTVTGVKQYTLTGHSYPVGSVAFSLDGRMLASGSWDNTIKLWDPATGVEQCTLTGHPLSVKSVAFSPDGRTLVSGSWDNTIKLWDPATGVKQYTLTGHSDSVWSLAFSPDGRMLASGSRDNTIKLWDPATGVKQCTLTGHSDSVWSLAFSPDGRILASGSGDHTIKLWNPATDAEQYTLTGHSNSVRSLAFSPDGHKLASGSSDHTIKLWDPATGIEQRTLKGYPSTVWSLAFSPDGRMLASGSGDNTIKLWDPATGAEQYTLTGHSDSVRSLAFSPNGHKLASGSDDNTIKLWDLATGIEQHTLKGYPSTVNSVFNQSPTSHFISIMDSWVSLQDQRTLWLPTAYRSLTSSAIKDTTLVLGLRDGRVSIIRFDFL